LPDNKLIRIVSDLKKKDKVLMELKSIRKHSTDGILQYNYKMAGTATGRFTVSSPPLHNFSSKTVEKSTFMLPEEDNCAKYDLRGLLLDTKGVFHLDFSSQENRMASYLCKNERRILGEKSFINLMRAKG